MHIERTVHVRSTPEQVPNLLDTPGMRGRIRRVTSANPPLDPVSL
jgi:hypothetical protein